MDSAIMCDHTVSMGKEEQHLIVPVVRRKRPAVMKHDGVRALWTPVFVEDGGAVFGCNRCHERFSLVT
jgi:hypothetical protein